ncbi:CbiX/SirB N-terminal domain-containing protein [Streptomyces chumphonensis]|uniref:Sirohydrochlorin chelatase n=1 Tax=Streptomyces chumphonensis TaxID=1214925 RepID=A0A927EVK9_9ACTN|nr:sirohydrochlorin chelatase [Streptomyces chumphonensis]MBD3930035.1 sirohydrochlorin chelatase [Streptomyces chumphonensis]
MTTAPALLAVGPGTRDASGTEGVRSFVGRLGDGGAGAPVAWALTGPGGPSPAEAVADLAGRGVRRLAVVPLTLDVDPGATGPGDAVARAVAAHPGLDAVCGRPLGAHPFVLDALERRVEEALGTTSRTPGDRADTTVLLVGRGTVEPEANAELHRAARLLWEGRGFAGVETAFVSVAAPDVTSGLERCRALGARRVVVLPYFLFPEDATDRAALQVEGWSAVYPETDVRLAGVLGAGASLTGLVWQRYREALACPGRAGAGCCAHPRAGAPGGAPCGEPGADFGEGPARA